MKFTIVAYRKVRGHDGQGFNATLAADGKKVCHVDDDGWGGGNSYSPIDAKGKPILGHVDQQTWWPEFKKQATEYCLGEAMCAEDIFVGNLIEDYDLVKTMTRKVKTAVLFVTNELKREGEYFEIKTTNHALTMDGIVTKYKDKGLTILNPFVLAGKFDEIKKFINIPTYAERKAAMDEMMKSS